MTIVVMDRRIRARLERNFYTNCFRIGRINEAAFRAYLVVLGFAGDELDAEVEWHRSRKSMT